MIAYSSDIDHEVRVGSSGGGISRRRIGAANGIEGISRIGA
jgi:hypothetical protein